MKLSILISNDKENGQLLKRVSIQDDNNGKDYSMNEIIEIIDRENPYLLFVYLRNFFTGNDLKSFLEAVKNSNITILKLSAEFSLEKDADFLIFLQVNVLDKILYPLTLGKPVNLDFMVKTEERVRKIVETEEISKVLQSYIPLSQSFSKSCSAYSIMSTLYKDTDDFNIHTELSIYKDIWLKPGDLANPVKIIAYLRKNNYNLNLIVDPLLSSNIVKKCPLLADKLLFFKTCLEKKYIHESPINDSNFIRNTTMLLFTNFGAHVIYAKRQSDGKIELHDPEFFGRKVFDTLDTFLIKEYDQEVALNTGLTGVSLVLSKKD